MEEQGTPKQQWVKWLTIGFLGTLTIFGLFTTIWVWNFTSIANFTPIEIDEKAGIVKVGGNVTIRFNDDDMSIDVKDVKVKNNRLLNGKIKIRVNGDKVIADVQDMKVEQK